MAYSTNLSSFQYLLRKNDLTPRMQVRIIFKGEVPWPENRIFHVYIMKDIVELWTFKKKYLNLV